MLRPASTFGTSAIAALFPLLLAACGSGSTISGTPQPVLAVDPDHVQLPMAALAVGETGAFDVVLSNPGNRTLSIQAVTLDYAPPADVDEAEPALRLDATSLPAFPVGIGVPGSGQSETLVVTLLYARLDDGFDRTATLRIESDDQNSPRTIAVSTVRPEPMLRVVPQVLDLGQVSMGETGSRQGTLRNSGAADLVVTGLTFSSDSPDFSLTLDSNGVPKTFRPTSDGARVALDPPLTLTPDAAAAFEVAYTANRNEPVAARLVLFSNDPSTREAGALVLARANQVGRCLEVSPPAIDFGGRVAPGQYLLPVALANCSPSETLTITRLALAGGVAGCAGPFCLDVPPEVADGAVSAESPLVVAPGSSVTVTVRYAPAQAAQVDTQGQLARDLATLQIDSDAFVAHTEVPVSGFGVGDDCPVAVMSVDEGEEVAPQTVLHLHGENSYGSAGAIVKYQWSVQQPALSTSKFVPSENYPSPSFAANVLGKYVFRLDVWDQFGRKSCFAASAEVVTATNCALHVELLWTSPGDPDPNDQGPMAGTDLDLHVAHPNASQQDLDGDGVKDPWFDPNWDVFWFYPLQNWGSVSSTDDNATLDLDDVDGNGPENVNLCLPEDGKTYHVGVNYWDDHGFGQSFATVRVYVHGTLAFEVNDVAMVDHDLCWIADVDWPSGQVKAKLKPNGGFWCTHGYHHPQFYQP